MTEFSARQRRVLDEPGVTLLGVDAVGRPVVDAMVGIPKQERRWALTRNGDPADIKYPVTHVEGGAI